MKWRIKMPNQDTKNISAILDEFIKTEKGLIRISQLIHDDIQSELDSINGIGEDIRTDRQEATRAFENFDQKANQLYNMLSTVMKSMNEMRSAVTRNLL
jgi:endonuclease III-like uncharacterized protein